MRSPARRPIYGGWLIWSRPRAFYGDHAGDMGGRRPRPLHHDKGRGPCPGSTAEARWQASLIAPLHIFRLAGIYGPRARTPLPRCVPVRRGGIIKRGKVFSPHPRRKTLPKRLKACHWQATTEFGGCLITCATTTPAAAQGCDRSRSGTARACPCPPRFSV